MRSKGEQRCAAGSGTSAATCSERWSLILLQVEGKHLEERERTFIHVGNLREDCTCSEQVIRGTATLSLRCDGHR